MIHGSSSSVGVIDAIAYPRSRRVGPTIHRGSAVPRGEDTPTSGPDRSARRCAPIGTATRTNEEAPMEPKELFFEERDSLVNTLKSLTPEQWDAASLCEGWRVRDV